ncbi:hypothetical protein D3C81_1387640 [compost metagenome]
MGAGIQPRIATTQRFQMQVALAQVTLVEIGDLQLATRRRLQVGGVVAGMAVVEVQTGDRIVGARLLRLLDQVDHLAGGVELGHAVALRVIDPVTEDGRAGVALVGVAQHFAQAVAVEDIVAQHQAARLAADELLADQVGLRQPVRARLHGVLDVHAPLRAVAQQALEQRLLVRRVDDQHVADAGQHQHAERVIDHRLVVHRQQLLADALRDRIQARTRATCEDDALALSHAVVLCLVITALRRWCRCAAGGSCRQARR